MPELERFRKIWSSYLTLLPIKELKSKEDKWFVEEYIPSQRQKRDGYKLALYYQRSALSNMPGRTPFVNNEKAGDFVAGYDVYLHYHFIWRIIYPHFQFHYTLDHITWPDWDSARLSCLLRHRGYLSTQHLSECFLLSGHINWSEIGKLLYVLSSTIFVRLLGTMLLFCQNHEPYKFWKSGALRAIFFATRIEPSGNKQGKQNQDI